MVEVIAKPLFSEMWERGRKAPHLFAQDFLNVECHPGQIAWLMRANEVTVNSSKKLRVLYPDATEGALACSNRWGKMLPLGSRLVGASTNNEPITMGTVRVGDQIYGLDGKPYRVTWVSPVQISTDAYAVVFSDGSRIVANSEHLWAVETTEARKQARKHDTEPQLQVLTTLELKQNLASNSVGAANFSIPVCAPVEYPAQDLPIDPYMLGVWLGDGHSNTGKYTSKDAEIAEELRRRGFTVHFRAPKDRCGEWRVEGLTTTLRGMGLLGNKHVPSEYLVGSVSQRLDLVRGLMDTDGYAESGGRCEFVTMSQFLASAMQELLESLGQVVTVRTGTTRLNGKDCGTKYRIKWSPTLDVFYLPRKLEKQRENLGNTSERRRRRYIVSIEPSLPQAMRCIAVDSPDRLYLTDHYIATHNTFIAAVKHLWCATYQVRDEEYRIDRVSGKIRDYRTANIAMSLDQAMLAFNYAYKLAADSKVYRRFLVDHKSTPFPQMVIGKQTGPEEDRWKSEIWARSTAKGARYLLGHNFNYLNWDEAAFDPALPTQVLDEVIRMRLTDQAGRLDFISSPNGYNRFQEIHALGMSNDPRFYAYTGNIFQNQINLGKPAMAYIREQMRKMHPDWVMQNIWGLFAKMSSLFSVDAVMRCYQDQDWATGNPRFLQPNHYVVENTSRDPDKPLFTVRKSSAALRYVVGVDLARKKDKTAVVVLLLPPDETDPLRVVYFQLIEKKGWEWQKQHITDICRQYNNAPLIIDSTGLGDVVLEDLQSEPYNLAADGRVFSSIGKQNLITQLQEYIQSASVVFPFDSDLVKQLTYYQWNDKKLETDAVMGLALAVEAAREAMGDQNVKPIETFDLPIFKLSRNMETMEKDQMFYEDPVDLVASLLATL